jgi:hypothetical protein
MPVPNISLTPAVARELQMQIVEGIVFFYVQTEV